MTQETATAKSTDTLLHAALRMLNEKIGALPVVNEADELVGILTRTDVLRALVFLLQREDASLPVDYVP
jgi:CBS domain-containing protein